MVEDFESRVNRFGTPAQYDRLVAEMAAVFVNAAADRVDAAIENALHRIVEVLDLDRGVVFRFIEADQDFILTHQWVRPGLPPVPKRTSAAAAFPWSLAKIVRGEAADFSTVDEIPDPIERESVRRYQTKSRVAVPIEIDGHLVGAMGLSCQREEVSWPPETVERLRLIAQIIGCALARKQSEAVLRESEQRFRQLADDAPVMIWTAGPDGLCTWFNRQWLEFVGQPLEHELGDGWTANVHPDDHAACLRDYRQHFDARRPFTLEYRLRRHDGEWRWFLDKGTPSHQDGAFAGYIGSCIDVTDQRLAARQLQQSRDELHAENVYLRSEVEDRLGTGAFVGRSDAIRRVLALVEQVAATDSTVLLLGETGTGKELLARRIHDLSSRRDRAMVRVNCAAMPATLIESELFGREKGAFTGALARQIGRFELADHSTIFLDEIGDLPPDVQVKLLRVLEERQFERLGSPRPIRVDTRIIAATHRNLEQLIAEETFRQDLFYRLNVFPIQVPPLRERGNDLSVLVWRFVEEYSRTFGKRIEEIAKENMAALQRYSWPGNIRELRNVVERAMIVASGPRLTIPVPETGAAAIELSSRLEDIEKEHIRRVLDAAGWRIRGAGGAAERLGLRPTTLETRMAKLGLTRPKVS